MKEYFSKGVALFRYFAPMIAISWFIIDVFYFKDIEDTMQEVRTLKEHVKVIEHRIEGIKK